MQKFLLFFSLLIFLLPLHSFAQPGPPIYFKGAIKEKKEALQKNLLNTINKDLSLPLNADTEEYWIDAFSAMEVLRYSSPWADGKINSAFDSIEIRSTYFHRALLELVYANYQDRFLKQVTSLMNNTADAKIFAICAEYLLLNKISQLPATTLQKKKDKLIKNEKDEAIIKQLLYRLKNVGKPTNYISLKEVLNSNFLKQYRTLYSFQRKNRNYPGIAVVRDSTGKFVKDETGNIFSVPQLARSISALPGYLTNGNTPQGIFRMYGFDTSKSTFIGPTTNIQLTMPFETSLQHFFNDSTISDTVWTEDWYKKLLPGSLKNCPAIFESFYAGMAGRTEIIAHGTTVNPEYYKGQIYYPQTPTMGCLCTKEIWDEVDGRRSESDQQKLVVAILKAGGPNGYCVVIEIDDEQKPVTLQEVLPWLNNNQQ
ncbi:MAG: hypothetical protein ABIN67_24280 [Ferruginibacter sp.]